MSSDSDQHSSFLPAFPNVSDMAILFLCHCCQLHTKPPITSSFRVSIIVWKEPRLSLQTVSLLLSAWPSLPLPDAHHHPSSLKTVQSNTGSGFKRLEVVRLIHYQTQLSNFISIADPAECAIELRTAKKGPFSPARSGNEAAFAGSSWHSVRVVFPQTSCCFQAQHSVKTLWVIGEWSTAELEERRSVLPQPSYQDQQQFVILSGSEFPDHMAAGARPVIQMLFYCKEQICQPTICSSFLLKWQQQLRKKEKKKTPTSHNYQSLWHNSAVIMIVLLLQVVKCNLLTCTVLSSISHIHSKHPNAVYRPDSCICKWLSVYPKPT